MGEIMRWRLARSAQRRIPADVSLLPLDGGGQYQINAQTLRRLQGLENGARTPGYAAYGQILSDVGSLQNYLTTGAGMVRPGRGALRRIVAPILAAPAGPQAPSTVSAAVAQAFIALLALDRWLASQGDAPTVADLTTEVDALLSAVLGTATWTTVHTLLDEIFYAALIISAYSRTTGNPVPLTEPLGWLGRLILVVGLVDLLQEPGSPLQIPQDIYEALRWRTPVLPEVITLILAALRRRNGAILVRKPGFADLYITREEWDRYEAAEIASIENILAHETKSHVHVLVNRTQTTTTTDTTTATTKEQDTTTTDLSQLQQQASSDITIAAHVNAQVDTSGQYGPTQVTTQLGGSLDYSNAQATSKSITQSHETVARAVNKVEKITRQVRTVSSMTEQIDKEKHKFDNQSNLPVVGIYRWVDQVQNVELDRYPHRFLMEFELPEPGAWTRWLHLNDASRAMINKLPPPLTITGLPGAAPLTPGQLGDAQTGTGTDYQSFVARYNVQGVNPPNPPTKMIALNLQFPQSGTDPKTDSVIDHFVSDSNLAIPDGYTATTWSASVISVFSDAGLNYVGPAESSITIAVGQGPAVRVPMNGGIGRLVNQPAGPISDGSIPVTVLAQLSEGFEVNIAVTCNATQASFEQWQTDTFAQISSAYTALVQAYNNEKAGLDVHETNLAMGGSDAQNAQTIIQELKRQIIEMLTGLPFQGYNAINWDPTGTNAPTAQLPIAAQIAPQIQFMEQAFEWETLSYICYPYYWADSSRWPDLAQLAGNDANYVNFLQAGSARVVLAARPGFEDQVNFYVNYGILWGGGPMPAPGDENYLSIADEIKAQQQRPLDMTVVDAWQVRLPTTLIWLENDAGLPVNPDPTILVITRVFPNSGSVGDSITIAGSNFQSAQGSSMVLFNGVPGVPSAWSNTSITVPVPANASTGNLVISVNGLTSNAVHFVVTVAANAPGPGVPLIARRAAPGAGPRAARKRRRARRPRA
jgi:hypothetical protein